jgi:aminoglycoside phosphotransferase (APT) family kinase protein
MQDLSATREDARFERLALRIDPDCKLRRVSPLRGGTSAQLTVLEIERADGRARKLVVRQHGATDLAADPDVAANEFRLLRLLRAMGLPVPSAHLLDDSGEILATPYIVIDCVEGERETAPADLPGFIHELATILAKIHAIDGSRPDLSFLPRQEATVAERLQRSSAADASDQARIRATLQSAWPLPQRNSAVLLHGDFWPGNTLWKDGGLAAVVDWEDAAVGDPLADLANCRLEVLWAFGLDAMTIFTRDYKRMTSDLDLTDLPYWDLYADLRLSPRIGDWGLDDDAEATLRERRRLFTAQAFEELGEERPKPVTRGGGNQWQR